MKATIARYLIGSIAGLFWLPLLSAQPAGNQAVGEPDGPAAPPASAPADPEAARAALKAAIAGVAEEQLYELAYRWDEGTELVWECEQSSSTRTRMGGTTEGTTARTSWQSRWVTGPSDSAGNLRFSSKVEWFTLWQQFDERAPVTFDSRNSGDVPDEFVSVPDQFSPRPSSYLVSPRGKIVRQETGSGARPVGPSEITIPLPDRPVPAGTSWHVPRELTARDDDQSVMRVALRTTWELTRVVDGKAYLTFRTEVLTPGLSATIRSQLMQNLARGYVIFDLKRGLPVYRETEWNEKVQSFAGADSFLQYTAKVTERLREDERLASVPPANAPPATDSSAGEKTETVAGPLTPQAEQPGGADDQQAP